MKNTKRFENLLETEFFGEGRRHYFVDLRLAKNNTVYLQIARSDRVSGEHESPKYERSDVKVFEDEIGMLIEAMFTVIGRYNSHKK